MLGRVRKSRRIGHRRSDPVARARPGRRSAFFCGAPMNMVPAKPKRASVAGRNPTAAAVAGKGWLRAHRWLLLRRAVQTGLQALFLVGPASVWLVDQGLLRQAWWPRSDEGRVGKGGVSTGKHG